MKAKPILLAVMGFLALGGPVWAVDGMVSYWKFDEGSGTTAFDLFGDNHGTIYGAQWIDGQVKAALTFNGVDDYVDIPFNSSLDRNASEGISISVWFKLNSYPAGWNQGPIFGLFDSADAGTKNYLFIDKPLYGNLITWDQYPPSYGWIKSIKPDLDTWYHIVVVENSTYRAIYLNGFLDISDNISESYQGNTPDTIRIGSRADIAPFYFDGSIDEVAIYNKALPVEDIEQLYNYSSAGYGYPIDAKLIATRRILRTIVEKLEALDKINAALEQEWMACDALQVSLENGYYGDLTKADIIRAGQKIHSSIQHQEQSIDALEKSIEKLQDTLAALGWEPPQPVSHWTFDEGQGTTAYDSAGDNHGTIHGAIWTIGHINGALSFDGVDDYVEVADDTTLDFTTVHTGTWINTSFKGIGAVVNKRDEKINVDWRGFVLFVEAGYVRFGADDGPNLSYTPISGTKIDDGQWHYIAGEFDGESVTTYVDGVKNTEADASSVTGNLNNDDELRIGAQWDGSSKYVHLFDGAIDDVMIFNSALSAQEIKLLYNNCLMGL